MRSLFRFSLFAAVAVICLSLVCCKKPFKSGVGLYSIKQYHTYHVDPVSLDSVRQSDTKVNTVLLDNGYLSWNNNTFHIKTKNDTVVTYICDSTINGSYHVLFIMQYQLTADKVAVFGYTTNTFWRSF